MESGTLDAFCAAAAEKIKQASFLFVGAGAGMSADSGLATYADVSNVFEYFEKNNLTYRDMSNPDLLIKKPNNFFGWCAVCVGKYANSAPHEGYTILKSWKDAYFTGTPITEVLHQQMSQNPLRDQPDKIAPLPGPCFVYSTNVDGFFSQAGFSKQEICSTHGSYLKWQCSGIPKVKHPFKLFDKPCTNDVWEVPDDFEFEVDIPNMSAPAGPPKKASSQPCWSSNHPSCPHCGQLARPNVYKFGDQCYIENKVEEANCANWGHAVENILKSKNQLSVVMLEIGVGKRLPKLRVRFERMLNSLKITNNAVIVRINPEIAKGDMGQGVIPIASGALDALKKIDHYLKK